jgi:hypothetical protein
VAERERGCFGERVVIRSVGRLIWQRALAGWIFCRISQSGNWDETPEILKCERVSGQPVHISGRRPWSGLQEIWRVNNWIADMNES